PPGFLGISSMTTIKEGRKTRGTSVVPVNCCKIATLRGSSRPDDDSPLVCRPRGEYIIILFRPGDHAASRPMWANDFLCIRVLCFRVGTSYSAECGFFP